MSRLLAQDFLLAGLPIQMNRTVTLSAFVSFTVA